jgi:hypothetical protein
MTVRNSVEELRVKTRSLCELFPDEHWRESDRNRRYPQEFVERLTKEGLLAALIPAQHGGLGVGLTEASMIMEEINKSGGHSAACHAQMYTMGPCFAMEMTTRRMHICRQSRPAIFAFRPFQSPKMLPDRTPPASRLLRSGTATSTSSPVTRAGQAGSTSQTWHSYSPARPKNPWKAERSGRTD